MGETVGERRVERRESSGGRRVRGLEFSRGGCRRGTIDPGGEAFAVVSVAAEGGEERGGRGRRTVSERAAGADGDALLDLGGEGLRVRGGAGGQRRARDGWGKR